MLWWVVVLQVWLDRLILLVKLGQVRDEILDNVHYRVENMSSNLARRRGILTVGERVDLGVLVLGSVDSAQACERVLSVDVHCTGTTDALSTRSAESECRVNLVLYLDERVENLATTQI